MKNFWVLSFTIFLLSADVFALPSQVILIRHAEKPEQGNEVNQAGCERAYSLPKFFLSNSVVNRFGAPVATFAQGLKNPSSSIRAIQTMAPTSLALKLPLQTPYSRDDYPSLVKLILSNSAYDGRTVLIAWEHAVIPDFAQAFGATLADNLQTWPGSVFDEAWVLTFSAGLDINSVSLQIIPEFVVPGDNPQGGANWTVTSQSDNSRPALQAGLAQTCLDNSSLNILVKQVTQAETYKTSHYKKQLLKKTQVN